MSDCEEKYGNDFNSYKLTRKGWTVGASKQFEGFYCHV